MMLAAVLLLLSGTTHAGMDDSGMCLHWARIECPTVHLDGDGLLTCTATGKAVVLEDECRGGVSGPAELRLDDLEPEGLEDYSRWRYVSEPVPKPVLDSMTAGMLRVFRNTFFAGHGRVFKDRALNGFFRGFSWYKPRADFREADLGAVEKANVDKADAAEKVRRAAEKRGSRRAAALAPFITADKASMRPDD